MGAAPFSSSFYKYLKKAPGPSWVLGNERDDPGKPAGLAVGRSRDQPLFLPGHHLCIVQCAIIISVHFGERLN